MKDGIIMKSQPSQEPQKKPIIHWTTLKGLASIISFLAVATLIELIVVFYAINLGVQENPENQIFGLISPLFHLVPITVIIALTTSWAHLTRHVGLGPREIDLKTKARPAEKQKGEGRKAKVFGNFWRRTFFAKATAKSAFIVLIVFLSLVCVVSLFAYPKLIYYAVSNLYQNNPSWLSFVKGAANALAPIGEIVNHSLLWLAPGFKGFASALGMIIKPLADLDNAGKYLVFQNAAAWVSGLIALFYGRYSRRIYRYVKRKKT